MLPPHFNAPPSRDNISLDSPDRATVHCTLNTLAQKSESFDNLAVVDSEKNASTLRRWGVTPDQTFRTLCESNRHVFRLQALNRVRGTNFESGALVASAYARRSSSTTELLSKRETIAETLNKSTDEVIRHIDMWNSGLPPNDTLFVSATFSLAWVFWEAARRSRKADGEREFTLIVMKSASLRDAGAVLGHEILFEQAQRNKSLKKVQAFTNICQEVIVPVIITSKEIIATVQLPAGSCVPSWITTTLSLDKAGYQPSASVPSKTEEHAMKSTSSGERSVEGEPQIADSNPHEGFREFCDNCASAYSKFSDPAKNKEATALALAILGNLDTVQPEDFAALSVDIWRWPTRLDRRDKGREWLKHQAEFDWPDRYKELLSSRKAPLPINELQDGSTSEESPTVPSPITLSGKRDISLIESDDLDSIPAQQDEQDSKRARLTFKSEMKEAR